MAILRHLQIFQDVIQQCIALTEFLDRGCVKWIRVPLGSPIHYCIILKMPGRFCRNFSFPISQQSAPFPD